jgi:3alpha(or 20beta)-hydroxysteroid dehydrogenase
MFDLSGKVAVVTGAASGIGKACATRLTQAGAEVVVLDVDRAGAEVAAQLGGRFVQADVSQPSQVEAAMAEAARGGRLDIVVNNAGIALALEPMTHTTDEHFMRHIEVNTLGVLHGMRFARQYLQAGSVICNTASVLGLLSAPGYSSYVASKFAVVGLTKTAAIEFGADGIRVNCVCPTTVDTPMLDTFPSARQEADSFSAISALNRIVDAEQVAALVHFLVADDCPVITGQAIAIDCGMTAGVSSVIWNVEGWN